MESPAPDARIVTLRARSVVPPVVPVAAGLVAGWCALSVGIAAKDGRYGGYAMAAVLAGWALVLVTVAHLGGVRAPRRLLGTPVRRAEARLGRPAGWLAWRLTWVAIALLVGLGPPLRHPHYYGEGPFVGVAKWLQIAAGLLAALTVLASVAPRTRPRPVRRACAALRSTWVFAAVTVLATGAGAAAIHAAPDPQIDVFHLLEDSSSGLLHARNMYHQVWATGSPGDLHGGLRDVYPYLPGTSLLLAPFRLLLGDVRYGLLAALVAAVVAIRALAPRRSPWPPVVPLLVMIFPSYCYSLEQSWTEPLLVAFLALMVWAARRGHGLVAVVALAVALATKQHVVLLLPLAALWPAFGLRRAVGSALLAAAAVAPWVIAGPSAFYHDAISTNLGYPVLDHSLSVPGWAHHFGITVGFPVMAVALACAYALAWRARGTGAGFAAGGALVELTLVELNKQSFFNHYTLPMALLVLALACALADSATRQVPAVPLQQAPALDDDRPASVAKPAATGSEPGLADALDRGA